MQKYNFKKTIVFLLIALYLFFFGFISILKYNSFSYADFDLAVHAQTLYNILHGSINSSILGVPFLGNHLNFILFLIAPIYAVFKSPITLLLLQALALSISSYPIYLIAKEQLSKKFSLLILVSYLLYPALGYVNLFEFHPTVFATFFISLSLYSIYKNRFNSVFVFIILALLCQENVALIAIFIGIYLAIIKKPLRLWAGMIILGGLWFWIGAYMLLPYFGRGTIKLIAIYGYLGGSLSEVIKNIFTHPIKILNIIATKQNTTYLLQIFGPVLFLPLLSPAAFLGAFPTILQHLLSLRPQEHTIYYHYTAEMIPFVFFASIFTIRKILSIKFMHKKDSFLAIGFLTVTVASSWIIGPHINEVVHLNKYFKTDLDNIKEGFLEKIPKNADVVATFEFLPKLSNRKGLYSLQNVVTGNYTLSDVPYKLPPTTEYAIVDFEDHLTFKTKFYHRQSGENLRRFFYNGNFGIVEMLDSIALFKKNFKSEYELYKVLATEPPISRKLSIIIDNQDKDIEFIGYNVDRAEAKKGIAPFKFYWRCLKNTNNIYSITLNVLDEKDRLIKQTTRFICYRVYPTNEWEERQIIEEFYRLLLPPNLPIEACQIKFDFSKIRDLLCDE